MSGSSRGAPHPRAINTCKECKRRKVRCDQRRPTCSRCASIAGLSCVYEADNKGRTFQFVPATPSSSSTPATSTTESAIALSPQRLRSLEERLENLNGMVQSLRSDSSSVVETVELEERNSPLSKRTRRASPDSNQTLDEGHLDVQTPGRTRYASRSFWASLCHEVSEIEFLLRSQNKFEDPMPEGPRWRKGSLMGLLLSPPPGPPPRTLSEIQERGDDVSYDERLHDLLYQHFFHPAI
jgi:hypothetical protein